MIENNFSSFSVFESRGRIGTSTGSFGRTSYSTLIDAEAAFKKIYHKMTDNEFGTNVFVKKPGKYYHIHIDNESLDQKLRNNSVPTKLKKPIHELMKLLFSDDRVLLSTLQEFFLDFDSMPLGKMAKKQIQDALNLLGEISSMVDVADAAWFISATNQFHSYFPYDYGQRPPPIINTRQLIQEKMNQLQLLLEKELKFQHLFSDSNVQKNLLDFCYEHLQESAEITMLNKSSEMYKQICNYVQNTQLRSLADGKVPWVANNF